MASIYDIKPKTSITPFNVASQPKPFNFNTPIGGVTPFNVMQPKTNVLPNSQSLLPTSTVSSTPIVATPRNTSVTSPVSSANQSPGSYKGVPIVGTDQASIMAQMAAIDSKPDPNYNPVNVDTGIGSTLGADALNGNPSVNKATESRKKYENVVLSNRYQKEADQTLESVTTLLSGLANLKGVQAKEYSTAETNPNGQLSSSLNSELSRLSKEQSLELSARTGQLNAQLDALKLYQGYAPSVIGSPQIDEATGEAFVYMQDPSTGQVITQSLGPMMTPKPANPYENYVSLSEGETLFDPATGEVIKSIPKSYAPKSGGGTGGSSGVGLNGNYAFNNSTEIVGNVDTILKALESGGSTGLSSLITRWGTGETGVANNAIKTLKSLVGFGQLQQMRDASPTGGALGQVSEREIDFLQSVEGVLGLYQNKDQLKTTLNKIKESNLRIRGSIKLENGFELTDAEKAAVTRGLADLTGKEGETSGMKAEDFGI